MSVQSVNSVSSHKRTANFHYTFSKYAGYGALGVAGLSIIQGIRHKKSHKFLGIFSAVLASIHVALIECLHSKNS